VHLVGGIGRVTHGFAALVVLVIATGCVTASHPFAVPGPSLDLHQPTAADLTRFAPGGVDASASASPTDGAPLFCGGTRASHLAGAAIVNIPNTLSQVSVRQYEFASASAASDYFDALLAQTSTVQAAHCIVTTPGPGTFSAVSLIQDTKSMVDASGTTIYTGGFFAGSRQYNVIRYVQQGRDVYIIELDRANGYAEASLEEEVLNAISSRPVSTSTTLPPTFVNRVQGVLSHATYQSLIAAAPGSWAESEDAYCPEVIANGVPYSIVFLNQLPNAQQGGIVVAGSGGQPITIPWGTRVMVAADSTHGRSSDLGCGPVTGKLLFQPAISVSPYP
jgi:hypothetical protein